MNALFKVQVLLALSIEPVNCRTCIEKFNFTSVLVICLTASNFSNSYYNNYLYCICLVDLLIIHCLSC